MSTVTRIRWPAGSTTYRAAAWMSSSSAARATAGANAESGLDGAAAGPTAEAIARTTASSAATGAMRTDARGMGAAGPPRAGSVTTAPIVTRVPGNVRSGSGRVGSQVAVRHHPPAPAPSPAERADDGCTEHDDGGEERHAEEHAPPALVPGAVPGAL